MEEEDGEWLDKEVDIRNITIRRPKLFKEGEEVKEQEAAALGLRGPKVARRNCQGAAKGGGGLDEGVRNRAGAMKNEDVALGTKGLDTARSICQGTAKGVGEQESTKENSKGVEREMGDRAKNMSGVRRKGVAAMGIEGPKVASGICQGAAKMTGVLGVKESERTCQGAVREEDEIRNMVGVKEDRCAPTSNCLGEQVPLLEKGAGEGCGGEGGRVANEIRRWESRDSQGDKTKEQGELLGQGGSLSLKSTVNKRRHSGTFICTTKKLVANEYETVRRLVGHWEARGKESGTIFDSPGTFSFGQTLETEQMVGSPLKKRRLTPLSPDGLTRPPPRPWTRPGTRPPCTSSSLSPRTSWRRPPSKFTKPWRAPPSATHSSQPCDLPASTSSRWPEWTGTRVGTWSSSSCWSRGSSSDATLAYDDQTSVYDSGPANHVQAKTGSTSTSQAIIEQAIPHGVVEVPEGHHHHLPEQDGSSGQLFGYYGHLLSLPGTSEGRKEIRIRNKLARKENTDTNIDNIENIDTNISISKEAQNLSARSEELRKKSNKKKEYSNKEETKLANEEPNEEDKKKEFRKTGASSTSSSSRSHSSIISAGKKVGTNLLPLVPEAVQGKPRKHPRPGSAASPPSSSPSACRGRTLSEHDGQLISRGEQGGIQGISYLEKFNCNFKTLFGGRQGKFAANDCGICVPPVSGKTTGERVVLCELANGKSGTSVICGPDLGLVEHQRTIPGE